MPEEDYHRKVQTSVTNFIQCGDEWLFLKRGPHKRIDPNRLNGVGGRVDPGENFLEAVIRETEEETGYIITPEQIRLVTIGRLEGGYAEDWVMAFFVTIVDTKKIPRGNQTEDGEFVWLHKDRVLDSDYELIDDLNYVWKDIISGTNITFFNAQVNEQEKIVDIRLGKLNR